MSARGYMVVPGEYGMPAELGSAGRPSDLGTSGALDQDVLPLTQTAPDEESEAGQSAVLGRNSRSAA
ncbi:hypothetical protein [Streptomyces sp. NPDC000229]|uniref:hypothetical protein n=1 Tax=Streptomyces sp. NPDC000229 TaxID=3154247 RepID=UPI003328B2E6